MIEYPSALNRLQAQFREITRGREPGVNSTRVHAAILDRLALDRSGAEAGGWSALALERDGGSGRLRLVGVAPGAERRTEVPDPT